MIGATTLLWSPPFETYVDDFMTSQCVMRKFLLPDDRSMTGIDGRSRGNVPCDSLRKGDNLLLFIRAVRFALFKTMLTPVCPPPRFFVLEPPLSISVWNKCLRLPVTVHRRFVIVKYISKIAASNSYVAHLHDFVTSVAIPSAWIYYLESTLSCSIFMLR